MFHHVSPWFFMFYPSWHPNGSLPPDFALSPPGSPGSPGSWFDIRRHALLLGLGLCTDPSFAPQNLMFIWFIYWKLPFSGVTPYSPKPKYRKNLVKYVPGYASNIPFWLVLDPMLTHKLSNISPKYPLWNYFPVIQRNSHIHTNLPHLSK